MRHEHFMGNWYNGSTILILLLGFAVILFYLLLRDYFKKKSSPEINKILEILKQRYMKNEISTDEYTERKMLIEDEKFNDPAMYILNERYALGQMDSREFVERRNEINLLVKTVLNLLKEQYARGQITTEEFREKQKEIQ
jgi:uncharacterized membrane protein